MNKIRMTARGFKLTEGIENKVLEEMNIDTQGRKVSDVNVVLSSEPSGKRAKIHLKLNKTTIRVSETNQCLYKAIESASSTLQKQIRKHLSKIKRPTSRNTIKYEFEDVNQEVEIERSKVTVKPMSEEEATLQMDAYDKRFLLFHNLDTGTPCVIYRRKGNSYGLIDSETNIPMEMSHLF